MSDTTPESPTETEDELQIDDTAEIPPVVEVQDDGSTPEPDQAPAEEDDS